MPQGSCSNSSVADIKSSPEEAPKQSSRASTPSSDVTGFLWDSEMEFSKALDCGNEPAITRTLTTPGFSEASRRIKFRELLVGGLEYPLVRVDPKSLDHLYVGDISENTSVYTTSTSVLTDLRDELFLTLGYFGPPADYGHRRVFQESRTGGEWDAKEAAVFVFPRVKLTIPNDCLSVFGLNEMATTENASIRCHSVPSKLDAFDELDEPLDRFWVLEQIGEGMYTTLFSESILHRAQTLVVNGQTFDLAKYDSSIDPKSIVWSMELRAVEMGPSRLAEELIDEDDMSETDEEAEVV